MLFYEIKWEFKDDSVFKSDRTRPRQIEREIEARSETYNRENGSQFYLGVELTSVGVDAGVAVDNCEGIEEKLKCYLDTVGFDMNCIYCEETTIRRFYETVPKPWEVNIIFKKHDIFRIMRFDTDFEEGTLSKSSRNLIYEAADKFFLKETFIPELNRIYSSRTKYKSHGHPVHYMIQTDDFDTQEGVSELLLQSLYDTKRIGSLRFSRISLESDSRFRPEHLESLYKFSLGGTMIISLFCSDETEDSDYASGDDYLIEKTAQVAKRFRNRVLTVFCLPKECTRIKSILFNQLGSMTLVELKEEFVDGEGAQSFLKNLAKKNGVRADKTLTGELEKGKSYFVSELHDIFDEWYGMRLKTTVFPQYKELMSVSNNIVKAKVKGNAYDELQEMIGLTEAKAVIKKALDYYKMQKVYEARGIKQDHPAMHMIFTGNPGTAKTSVARLFAQIMKDNKLLSNGQLIEVGRADLVGKYVGWTAQLVKEKFKSASGGVLFVDEAYSLVDDKDGLYGDEAINTIVQEMENHRGNVVVIFAGYPDKMEKFLQKNPGLRSRIAFHIPFADYSTEELCKITNLMSNKKGFTLTEDALRKLGTIYEEARKQSDFGNGRYARNILEQARMAQASRLIENDVDEITMTELTTIEAEDVPVPAKPVQIEHKIGFTA